MIKAMLLDVDGTLVCSNEAHARAWAEALERFGYAVPFDRIRRWIGMGGDKILPRVDAKLDDEHAPGASIVKLRGEIFLERYAPHLEPTPGARELLERLHALGIVRAVATSAKKNESDAILAAAGIADLIDLATTSDDAERSKPDADILESALTKAKVAAAEAVYLGDTPYDVAAARKAGITVIALTCGGWNDEDLAGADAIYATPEALLHSTEGMSMFARPGTTAS